MKNGVLFFIMMIIAFSCHDTGPDPIDNPNDPMDTMKVDTMDTLITPVDTFLINIYKKWGGDYLGEEIKKHYYKQDSTIDTIRNMILKVKRISRDTLYPGTFHVILESQSSEWDPLYAGEDWFYQDSMHFTWVLGSTYLDVIMDGINKTITTYYAYTPLAPYPDNYFSWGFYRKVE